jgi:hypothetical protein
MRTHGSIFVVVTCILKIPWLRVEHVLEKKQKEKKSLAGSH